MDREQRKRELEEKKRRLQELRRLKHERKQQQEQEQDEGISTGRNDSVDGEGTRTVVGAANATKTPASPAGGLDNFIDELLRAPVPGESAENSKSAANVAEHDKKGNEDEPTTTAMAIEVAKPEPARKPQLKLAVHLAEVNVPARPLERYDKAIQTDDVSVATGGGEEDGQRRVDNKGSTSPLPKRVLSPTRTGGGSNGHDEPTSPRQGATQSEEEARREELMHMPPLEEEDRKLVEEANEFVSFVQQNTRVVERALKQSSEFDVAIDYGGDDKDGEKDEKGGRVVKICDFFDERYSKDRTVTALQWSPHHKELFLVAHNKRTVGSGSDWPLLGSDPDGVVLLWSLHMKERPEYVFTCQSEVHSALFHPFAPNLLVGGTYSGEIVMWDLRSKSTPIQRTMLSSEGHTHPVYSMNIVGSTNAHSLVSVSTDGRLCLWSLSNMSSPTESRILKAQNNKRDVAATCIAFPEGETNEFALGSEEGTLYRAQVHGTRAGIQSGYSAHFGPITALDYHRGSSATSDLLLSCSMDFSIKLWSHRVSEKPLCTFESACDYIYDVKWSPVHPSLFVACDGTGSFDLWNINVDTEVPLERIQSESGFACSSLQWTADGRKIIIGNSKGKLELFDVAAEIAQPRRDEWTRLEDTITSLGELIEPQQPEDES